MALHSGLSIWCYTAPTSNRPLVGPVEYGTALESLRFTTVAPGGYGQLTALLKVPDARVPRPELGIFSRIVVTCGKDALWLGEIAESKAALQAGQEAILITALGLGNALRDDPLSATYNAQTVQQIAVAQLQIRTVTHHDWTGVIDGDTSQLFPDNPAGTYGPVYVNNQLEEVLDDLCQVAAANASALYTWGGQAHPQNRDAAGFPTLQLFAVKRDTATTHFRASVAAGEVTEYEIGQSAERCYNAVFIGYNNGSGGVAYASATDSRLNGDLSQGSAPFRWRKYVRDYSGTSTMNSSTAAALAAAYRNQYDQPSNTGKSTITLLAARDAAGNPTELARVAAGRNILVPEMAVRGDQLPTGAVAGVNQFYIVSAEYVEDQTSARMQLQCDNFADYASYYLARLTLAADTRARDDTTAANFQRPGAPETGYCGGSFQATAGAQVGNSGSNFKTIMATAPASVSVSSVVSSVNATGASATNIDVYGFNVTWQSVAAGLSTYLAHYVTSGNCLLAVHAGAADDDGTFDWHCDGCTAAAARAHGCGGGRLGAGDACAACHAAGIHRGLRLREHVHVYRPALPDGGAHERPGDTGLRVACPRPGCGFVECFNTALTADDEAHPDARRAEQARLIRAAMRHPHVALPTHEEWQARRVADERRVGAAPASVRHQARRSSSRSAGVIAGSSSSEDATQRQRRQRR